MNKDAALRSLFRFLIAAAAVSFALCIVSDVWMSASHPAAADRLTVALTWLAGHGLHGATVVLLPATYILWRRSLAANPTSPVVE